MITQIGVRLHRFKKGDNGMKKLIGILALLLITPVALGQTSRVPWPTASIQRPPQVRLTAPVSEEVFLPPEGQLEFRWEPRSAGRRWRKHYDFRLYRGYEPTAENLILHNRLSGNTHKLILDATIFQDNEIYTWSVTQTNYKGFRSPPGFRSFRVRKK